MTMTMQTPRTLFEKVWDSHIVADEGNGASLIYIDLHLVNEVTSPQAFEGLRLAGRKLRRPDRTLAVADHNVPTDRGSGGVETIIDPESRLQVETLERNVAEFGVPYIPLNSDAQGIVHIIGPEMGLTLPGTIVVCGDSHTSTHGAFGALAFGIGTSEAEHVLATQTLLQIRPKTILVEVQGQLPDGVSAKDLILHIIGQIGTAGATGYVIEYRGEAVDALEMAGRMTMCNMTIEAGARAGMIAPDHKTFAWLKAAPCAPKGAAWDAALKDWAEFRSDEGAVYDRQMQIDASSIAPMVTWGTTPEAVIPVTNAVPLLRDDAPAAQRSKSDAMLRYMGLNAGAELIGTPIDMAFIGSCTNGRIEDLRAAAAMIKGRTIAPHVRALVVPGSGRVKAEAEAEGLDRMFMNAGFEWRDPGCSMCLGMNPDQLKPGQRCVSTSNRNFEGRQGPDGRTHLMSPAMAAAAAIHGKIVDARSA